MKSINVMLEQKDTVFQKIDYVILSVIIAHEGFFFSVNSMLGREYLGSSHSSTYRLFLLSLLIYLLFRVFTKVRVLNIRYLIFLLVPLVFISLSQITKLLYGTNAVFNSSILYIFCWQYMGILLAINMHYKITTDRVEYYFRFVIYILTISVAMVSVRAYGVGHAIESIGGATYQSASYYAAFCFGMTLYYLQKNKDRVKAITEMVIYGLLLVIQFISLVLSGGRGAMVLLIAYICLYLLLGNKKNRVRNVVLLLLLVFILFFIIKRLDTNLMSHQFNRIFSYLTSSGLNLANTSGRDMIYSRAMLYIKQSPIIGYGLLSYYFLMNGSYPHNFVLEVLMEGGIVYFLIWILVLILAFRTFSKMNSNNKLFILFIGLYPICMLMFSGSYSYCMLFWFFISFVFCNKNLGRVYK